LTALLTELRLFQTGSIPLPASRFLCEHLHQNLFRACISRIHAQVPVVTTGQQVLDTNQIGQVFGGFLPLSGWPEKLNNRQHACL
jgi:hypothetical protein